MTENTKELEVQPRVKVLFVNMGPTSTRPTLQIATGIFGQEGKDLKDFQQMMLTRIQSPSLQKGESSGSLRQIMSSTLELPRVGDISAAIITGSSLVGTLLKRDLKVFGIQREGKGVFLPDWQRELADFTNEVKRSGKPMLGICFGGEMDAEALGGKVTMIGKTEEGERIRDVGFSRINIVSGDPLFEGVPNPFVGVVNHDYRIVKLPPGAQLLAKNNFGVQAFRIGNIWAVQFHPEKTLKDADKLLADPKNIGKFHPEIQAKLRVQFNQEYGSKVLSNFMRLAWSGVQ